MPTPLSSMRDRLPEVLERAEATLSALREIVGRIPASLDRSDLFFTNVERIIRESDLPALSADSRKFFASTSAQIQATGAQIEQMTNDLEGALGAQGTLVTFVDEGAHRHKRRRPSRHESVRAHRGGADDTRGRRPAFVAAGHPRFARAAARPRAAAAGAARVDGVWPQAPGGEAMIRVPGLAGPSWP